jgi:NAD-specific glutamate dehydrogenase
MMLNETDEFMARILQVAQVNQEVMDTVDLNEYANVIAEAYNQDKRVVRDLLDVQNIKKQRAQQQETMAVEQMKNEKAAADAKVMQAGSKAPEAGSPVEAMMKGAQ